MNPQRTVLVAMVTAAGVASIGHLASGKGADRGLLRIGLGTVVAGSMLSIGADFAPQLATSFAMLILVTSVVVYGGPAAQGISNVFTKKG